jgi:hypothetical protein
MTTRRRRHTTIILYCYALSEGWYSAALAISLAYKNEYGRNIEIDILPI